MDFNEQLPEWHATGVEPPESKKTEGWGPDDKPPADWFNWLFNRAYKVLNEIRTILGGHVDATAPHIGHETPVSAQAKADAAETKAKQYTDTHFSDLAGVDRTTQTVKGNADAIEALQKDLVKITTSQAEPDNLRAGDWWYKEI